MGKVKSCWRIWFWHLSFQKFSVQIMMIGVKGLITNFWKERRHTGQRGGAHGCDMRLLVTPWATELQLWSAKCCRIHTIYAKYLNTKDPTGSSSYWGSFPKPCIWYTWIVRVWDFPVICPLNQSIDWLIWLYPLVNCHIAMEKNHRS